MNAVAISATFTAEPLREPLEFWMRELGYSYSPHFAAYNQVFQSLLDPAGLFASNRDGINVVLVRFDDWRRYREDSTDSVIEENVRSLSDAIRSSTHTCPAPLFVFAQGAREMEELLAANLAGVSNVYVLAAAEMGALYPVPDSYDAHGDKTGHIPYSPAFFAALATFIARKIHAQQMMPYKVIALDCDNTLWNGICGEDGPDGIEIDEPRRALQEFMVAQRDAGMLLCLCSKNNEEDVWETFRMHPSMPLRREHITASRIDWEPKSSNLSSLAGDLRLGLDSFIFVDDDAKECAEVQANCPEVLTLPFPVDVRHIWAFDHLRVTAEDRGRTASYATHLERERFEKKAVTLDEFLAGLQLRVHIAPMMLEQLPRVAQLTARTNQMNFTTRRRNEGEITVLLADGRVECFTVEASDRFGSYGLVGVMLLVADRLDTFLLSCRALGRGIEHRMLAHLAGTAHKSIEVSFIPTAKNKPALRFLESIGNAYRTETNDGLHFTFPADYLGNIRPATAAPTHEIPNRDRAAVVAQARHFNAYLRIAHELSTAQQVLEHSRPLRRETSTSEAPRTERERQIAAVWTELLGVANVGIHDNFFDLGGHSLLAVQLLSHLRQAVGVELPLDVVYSGNLTVADLAQAIEIHADPPRYASILAEIEELTDEEVKALLAAEEAQ